MAYPALELIDFHAWHQYRGALIRGLNVKVAQGETIAFLSPNRHARQVLVDSLVGRHKDKQGSIRILNTETSHLDTASLQRFGIVYCDPQGGIVPHLNTEENLLLPPFGSSLVGGGLPLLEIFLLFPQLEQELYTLSSSLNPSLKLQLAWARVLRTGARIFIFHGLKQYLAAAQPLALEPLLKQLNQRNYTIILVDNQDSNIAQYSSQHYALEPTPCHSRC